MDTEDNYIIDLATRCINQTNTPLFLTGKAGTGKTTFLRNIVQQTHKNTIVVAPTGVAAINAGGVTIHSLFQLPFGLFLPTTKTQTDVHPQVPVNNRNSIIRHLQMHERKRKLLREVELLIIDEVSMLRADLLDAIDSVLRYVRRKNHLPFGGVQLLFIGDLLQLPPVVKDEEWQLLKEYYNSIYFFDALVLKEQQPVYIELQKIYRQSDNRFIRLLNHIRDNEIDEDDAELLNNYYQPEFEREQHDNIITLTTHNYKAESINKNELQKIPSDAFVYEATVTDEFSEHSYPLDKKLELKEGAQVMFIKNDLSEDKLYYNGKIGTVAELTKDRIKVQFSDTHDIIDVDKYVWKNIRYTLNEETNEIEEKVIGTFTHYPIKLAWAITVHKSQGLTFEKAVLDINDAFASGQTYVALSRLRSLHGLILTSPINFSRLRSDGTVTAYSENNSKSEEILETRIEGEKIGYLESYLSDSFNFNALYFEIRNHTDSYTKDEHRSEKQKHYLWAKQLSDDFIPVKSNADTFSAQLRRLFQQHSTDNLLFIEERTKKATEYFSQQLKKFSERIAAHRKAVQEEKKVKIYQSELHDLDNAFFRQLQAVTKASALITAVLHNTTFNKQTSGIADLQQERNAQLQQLTEIVGEFKNEKTRIKKTDKTAEKEPKVSTKEISLAMHKEGKTVDEIAAARNLSASTIEGHLSHYISTGDLSIAQFLPAEKLEHILTCARTLEIPTYSAVRQLLGDEYTYGEIRMAMSYHSYLETQQTT